MSKNLYTICCRIYRTNYYPYHAENFPDLIPLLKVDYFERFLNWCKIDGMVNDNSSSCHSKYFLKIKKDDLQYLNNTTSQTNEAMALKFFLHTTLLLKSHVLKDY